MATIDNIFEGLKAWPASKKTAVLAVIVFSIAGMFLMFAWVQKADFQVLYSNLSDDDAGAIVQELKAKKIPYQVSATGTILVSGDKVYDLRLELASQGLPQGGGIGFEIFDNTSFTTSQFVQKLNYKRALEGELSRTIRSLAAVEQSRVHLAIPDKSVFAFQKDTPQASAAVFVTLKKGRKLSGKEVEGIVHLVSSSVEDLSPEGITVLDSKGELFTSSSEDGMINLSGSQLEYQQNYEKGIMTKVVSILEPVVGRGKINARVSADFDFTRSERTEEIYDPEGVVVRSESKSTEKTTSGAIGGTPGVAANLPGGNPQRSSSSGGQSQKQDEMINYETSKTVKRTIDSPISLKRLTVAILIDGILPAQQSSIENPDQYAVHSEADVQYYEDIVKKTVGFTDDRGDEISVTVMPFKTIEAEPIPEIEKDYLPIIFAALKYIVPIIVALMFYLLIVRPLLRSLPKAQPAPAITNAAAQQLPEPVDLEPLHVKEIPMEKQVIDWAANNPEQAAGLVKGWVEE